MSIALTSNQPPISHVTPWVSWAAVVAGCVTAIAFQIALAELCLGTGLAMYEPGDASSSGANIAAGTAIAMLVCALISIFAGGWVAGRMKRHGTHSEAAVHGLLVWALGSILAMLLTTVSLGLITSGAFSLIGQGVAGTAKGMSAGMTAAVPAMAQLAAPGWDAIKQQVEGATAKPEVQNGVPANENRFTERSRLMQILGQTFTPGAAPLGDAEQQEVQGLLASQMGISPEAARTMFAQWQRVWNEGMKRYQMAKDEAKQAAIDAATTAKKRTAQAAIIGFFVMLAGLGAAIGGALCGSKCLWTCARVEAENLPSRSAIT